MDRSADSSHQAQGQKCPQPYPSDHENAIPLDRVTGDPFPARLRSRPRATRDGARRQSGAVGPVGPGHSLGPGVPILTLGPFGTELSAVTLGPVHAKLSIDALGPFNSDLSRGTSTSGPAAGGAPPSCASSGGTPPSRPATPAAAGGSSSTPGGATHPAGAAAAPDHATGDAFPHAAECDASHAAYVQAGDSSGLLRHAVRSPDPATPAAGDPADAAGGEEDRAP
jgi:hypothetical protein